MAQVGTLTVDLIAQTASFNANISKAAANLNSNAAKMNRSIATLQTGIDKTTAAVRALSLLTAGGLLVGAAKKSLEFAGSLGEVAQQVGVTSRELQVYRYIGGQVGVTTEEMDKGLAKLSVSTGQAALGAKAQGKAFEALGISVRDSTGHVKTAGDILPEIANRLSKISDPAQRAAAEIALFGRAGQKLDPILSKGQGNIESYAKRAEELGMVLDDHLINQADEAADRMEELTTQMKVNFAGVVAANANSILGLANALSTLTVGVINFISQYPRFSAALAGVALGSRIGGLPGAVVGGVGGALLGNNIAGKQDDANMDLAFRRGQLNKSLADLRRAQAAEKDKPLFRIRSGSATSVHSAAEEVKRQATLTRQAAAAARGGGALPALPPADLPSFLASGGGGGGHRAREDHSAERAAEEARRRQEAYEDQLSRLNTEMLSAKRDNLTGITELAQNARQQVMAEDAALIVDIERGVKAGDLTRAQADQLEAQLAQVRSEKLLTINTEEAAQKAEEAFNLQLAANDNQRDMLQLQDALATTAGERRKSALALLDLDRQEEEAKLRQVIAMGLLGKATEAEVAAARARLAALPGIYDKRTEVANRQTEGPMAAYLRDIDLTGDKMNEALEGVKVRGLQAFTDGLVDAIVNFRSLGDVAKNVLAQIAADLLRLQIQKAIFSIIGGSLGGSGGGLAADAASTIASNPQLFANGTTGAPGGWAFVGERGPELVNLRPGQQVIPNHRLPQMMAPQFGRAGNDNFTLNVHVNGAMNEKHARETGDQLGRAIRRQLNGPVRVR